MFQRCPPFPAWSRPGWVVAPAMGAPALRFAPLRASALAGLGGCAPGPPLRSGARSCVVSCGAGGGLVGCGPSLGDAQRACGVGRGLPVA